MAASPPCVATTVLMVSTTATAGITAAAPGVQRVGHAVENGFGGEGAGGIVHQDRLHAFHQGSEAGPDRAGAGGAAVHHCQEGSAVGQFVPERIALGAEPVVAGRQGHADLHADAGGNNAPQGMDQDGVAAQGHLPPWACRSRAVALILLPPGSPR